MWGRARAPAAARPSVLCSSERRVNLVISIPPLLARRENAAGASGSLLRPRSAVGDRVFGEDLLDPLEGLLRRRLRRHPAGRDVGPAGRPNMLVLDLGI